MEMNGMIFFFFFFFGEENEMYLSKGKQWKKNGI